jgi:hypothetical protein
MPTRSAGLLLLVAIVPGGCTLREQVTTGTPCLDDDDTLQLVACIAPGCGEEILSITCQAWFDGQTWEVDDRVETQRPRLRPGRTCSTDCVYTATACDLPLGSAAPVLGEAFLHESANVSPPGGVLDTCAEIDARWHPGD